VCKGMQCLLHYIMLPLTGLLPAQLLLAVAVFVWIPCGMALAVFPANYSIASYRQPTGNGL
jgi:hypothetical protein